MSITFEEINGLNCYINIPWFLIAAFAVLIESNIVKAQVWEPKSVLEADSLFDSTKAKQILRFETDSSTNAVFNPEHLFKYHQFLDEQFPSFIIQYLKAIPADKPVDIPRKQLSEDWMFYMALLLLILLTIIRFGYAKEFDDLLSVFKNLGPTQQMYRELETGVSFGTVLLNLFAVIVLSFYIFLLISYYNLIPQLEGWLIMIISLIVISLFLFLRYVSLKLASFLLPFRKEIDLYNFYEIQVNQVLGVILFPLILLIAFSISPFKEIAFYSSLLIVAFFIFLRYLKGFNIGINYFGRHLFHFLLYICALEIAPVLIIIRLLQSLDSLTISL